MMDIKYYCEECCKTLGKRYTKDAENQVGRKQCSECGTNEPDYFKCELDDELEW